MRSDFLNAFQLFEGAAKRYEEVTLDPMLVFAPQAGHRQSCARCSVTTRGSGSGRSNTCRALWPTLVSGSRPAPHPEQADG